MKFKKKINFILLNLRYIEYAKISFNSIILNILFKKNKLMKQIKIRIIIEINLKKK